VACESSARRPTPVPAVVPSVALDVGWNLLSTVASSKPFTVKVQPKLEIGAVDDPLEREADAVAAQVMRMPAPLIDSPTGSIPIQRKCDACERDDEEKNTVARKAADASPDALSAPPAVVEILEQRGTPLDSNSKAFFEPRFGRDFSKVQVHTDARAAAATKSIQALAYTAGHHIAFNDGQYAPGTERGKRLLAHELAHVVQQKADAPVSRIARFSDDTHNVIEEAALALASLKPAGAEPDDETKTTRFSHEEIGQVHKGNTRRDYSQSPAAVNLFLLCQPSNFGGYDAVEHFDNFRWSEELQQWQSRSHPTALNRTPIDHIRAQLIAFVVALPSKEAFQHVGNAFHTIEDFFAHSNFVELTHRDFSHGRELITGSVGSSDDVSLLKIGESISSQETAPLYGEQATREIAQAPPGSHSRMAKDYKSNPYRLEAIVLAGLVVKDIGTDILHLKLLPTQEERSRYVRDVIVEKLRRYFRPPDDRDKWWERLRESGGREMEKSIRETAARTPVTKNQCFLSPMRSIEASKDSNLKLLGPAFALPLKNGHVWIQAGTGFVTSPAFKGPSGEVAPRNLDFVPVGVQVTGRFDLFGGGK